MAGNADDTNIQMVAFEAVLVLIENASPDHQPLFIKLLSLMARRLVGKCVSLPMSTYEDKDLKEGM